MTETKQSIRWGRVAIYLVIYYITLVYIYYSLPVTYSYYRHVFLAQMNRVYEKDQLKRDQVDMANIATRQMPAMPVRESDLP